MTIAQISENRERTPLERYRSRRLRCSSGAAAVVMVGLGLVFLASRGHSPAVIETVTTIPPVSAAPDAASATRPVAPIERLEPTPPPPSVELTDRPVEPPVPTLAVATPPPSPVTPAASSPTVAIKAAARPVEPPA